MKPIPANRFAAFASAASSLSSVAFMIAVALDPIANAGNTWDGGGSGFWNSTTNSNVDGLPATGTALTFAGDVQNSTSNDPVASDPSFAGLLFTNTGAESNANAFTPGGDIATTAY